MEMEKLPKLAVRVRPYIDLSDRPTKLMGLAELLIADAFVIKGIRVLAKSEGDTGLFVVFPAEKGKGMDSDRWHDLAHPVTMEARKACISLILAEYEKVMKGGN